ncbi:MAG: zinc dependent phospholipase C family protein [Eubacteriales bacterium]
MPAFYTHARFGAKVLEALSPDIREIANKYPELFYIGLQGPDILFYHKAYQGNEISKAGYAQHRKAGYEFFEPARQIIRESDNQEAAFSYIAGFICHFTLDSQCHPYIGTVEQDTKLSHAEIEAEEDRYLMIQDGKDPLRHLAVNQVVISELNTAVIAEFFEVTVQEDIRRALRHMKFFSRLFCAPSKCKRTMVYAALKLAGKYKGLSGMIVNYEENPKCYESTRKIAELCEGAIPIACDLIAEYHTAVENLEVRLGERYTMTFGEE